MILIISEEKDVTTDQVVDWLLSFKTVFKRQNYETANMLDSFVINNNTTSLKINSINQKDITKVWYRRGQFTLFKMSLNSSSVNSINELASLNNYISDEVAVIENSIESFLRSENSYCVGSRLADNTINKLDVLLTAKKNKLLIPDTLITSNKEEILHFYTTYKTIITKDLKAPVHFSIRNNNHTSIGTFVVTKKMITTLEDDFFPIFVQKKIDKKYEIRIFYYNGKLFPMAIFSQKDKKTAVDYRNYNTENPNKCVPVILPKEIQENLLKTLQDLNLNTCSIDFIVSKAGEYIFLEVNPMGQLDWVSKNCNYYIEKYIAEDLVKV